MADPVHLYKPAAAYRLLRNTNDDTPFPPEVPHAENPPLGAILYYALKQKPQSPIKLDILDSRGNLVRHYSSEPIAPYDDPAPLVPEFWRETIKPLPTDVGLNRFNWNGRYDTPPAFTHDLSDVMGAMAGDTPAGIEGPLAPPGTYTARLTVDGKVYSQKFSLKNDPRSVATSRDIEENHAYRMNLVTAVVEAYDGYGEVTRLRSILAKTMALKLTADLAKDTKTLDDALAQIGGTATHVRKFYGPPQPDSFVGLNGYILAHLETFNNGDEVLTEAMLETYGSDWFKLNAVLERWRKVLTKDLPALNAKLHKAGFSTIDFSAKKLTDPRRPAKKYIPVPQPAVTAPAMTLPAG